MFTPIDRLPRFDLENHAKYRGRWEDTTGQALRDKILAMIRAGAGEDFLQQDFEAGELGFLEEMWDLKGLNIFQEQFDFPRGDTFENIDFSHAEFYHSAFNNAAFVGSSIAFAKIYNCTFKRCIFSFAHSYGTTFEKCTFVECDFVESNTFTNCVFRDVSFDQCFMPTRLFFDSSFDQLTRVGRSAPTPFRMNSGSFQIDLRNASDILGGIEDAYRDGRVPSKAREYYFLKMQAVTRHNSSSRREKLFGFVKEYLAGYGVRPWRVLAVMAAVLGMSTVLFSAVLGFTDGSILAAGALFTFGAKADLLDKLGSIHRMFYILTAFVGIALTALFITVLANVWFRDS